MATTVTTPKVGDCQKPAVDAKALWYRTGVIIPTEQPRVRWTTEKFSEGAPDCEAKSVRAELGSGGSVVSRHAHFGRSAIQS